MMAENIWLGGIYLKEEGGYEIILKSLNHYKKRLKTLSQSPELKESAAMFASVLNQQARKTVPEVDKITEKIHSSLNENTICDELKKDVSFLEKALACYESDIHKAEDTGHEYFVNLVGDMIQARKDLETIKVALSKIKCFSK